MRRIRAKVQPDLRRGVMNYMKRFLYIFGVVIVGLILTIVGLFFVITSDKVGTAIAQRVVDNFSGTLGVEAHIGSVEYHFPARLTLRGIYVEDQQKDTLVYLDEVYVHFKPLAFLRHGEVHFSHARVVGGRAKMYEVDSLGVWNYQFVLDAMQSDTAKRDGSFDKMLSIRDIQLRDLQIQYQSYDVVLSQANVDVRCFTRDSIDARIDELAMRMRSSVVDTTSLDILEFQAHVCKSDSVFTIPTFHMRMPHSCVDLGGIRFDQRDASFIVPLKQVEIVPADFALFSASCNKLRKIAYVGGELCGTEDFIRWDGLAFGYDGERMIRGDISMRDMRTSPYLKASLDELHIHMVRLQDILSRLKGQPMSLPKELLRLGDVRYLGRVEGYVHDLRLDGALSTDMGRVVTKASLQSDSAFEHFEYDVQLEAQHVKLGRLMDNPALGTATLALQTKGELEKDDLRGDVNIVVEEFTYNGYAYQDMSIEGSYAPRLYDAHLLIKDERLDIRLDGQLDMRSSLMATMDIRCEQFDSYPLFSSDADGSHARMRFNASTEIAGKDADDVSGSLVVDSFFLATELDSIMMRQLQLHLDADANRKTITLHSDYLNGQVDGSFRYADIIPACHSLLHRYLPSIIPSPRSSCHGVSFTMYAEGNRLTEVQRLFDAPFAVSDHPRLDITMCMDGVSSPQVDARLLFPGARLNESPLKNTLLTLSSTDERSLGGDALTLSLSTETGYTKTTISAKAFRDTIETQISIDTFTYVHPLLPEGWREMSPRELRNTLLGTMDLYETKQVLVGAQRAGVYGGEVKAVTHFSARDGKPLIDVHILPDTLLLRNSIYTLGDGRIRYSAADTSLTIDGFSFRGDGQYIEANGVVSRNSADSLLVHLHKIDASYVVPFVLPKQIIMFDGLLTGVLSMGGALKQPKINGAIHVDGMGLNGCHFGEAEVDIRIYPERRLSGVILPPQLEFHADVYQPTRHVVGLDGEAFFDGTGRWKLDMQTDSVPLDFINHWTSTVLHDLDGYGTGKVVVGGAKKKVYVLVDAVAQDASFVVPWTSTRYYIDDQTIIMDSTSIRFPEVYAKDADGHRVFVNGGIYHEQFQDFVLDLHVDAYDALVFNANKQGEMLQGNVYANGHVDITGHESDILVAANAVTSGKSQFRLSVDNVSSAYSANFVHFKQCADTIVRSDEPDEFDNLDIRTSDEKKAIAKSARTNRCLLTLNIEVNPQLLFQLVLGERNGDVIQAHGNGALKLTYDTQTGDVRLLGTYDIEQGTLSYTVANVIRKEFTIGDGSTIVFSGEPDNPQLDVIAKYRVTASLKDLFGEDVDQLATTRMNIPVFTCLHMKDALSNPTLSFSLEFPTSDQSIQQQVQQVINTDEMLMRQVIYLLVFGRFFTPDYASQLQYTTLNSTYSLLSSTVTSQINAWLSKLTDVLTLGVAIRTDGEGSNSSQEYEAQFQLQPIDRLIINGNVGYRYNDISNQPFFGDLDVEVMLTEDGQFRLKGYTHTVDKYSLREASTIQGVGFVWKKDFNWHKKRKAKKPTPSPSLKGRENEEAYPQPLPEGKGVESQELKVESQELKVESQEGKVENKK